MNSIDSVNAKLQMAMAALDQATHEIDGLALGPAHLRDLRTALGSILHVQQELRRNHHEPAAPRSDTAVDAGPDLTQEEAELVASLSQAELEEIDAALLSYAKRSWRKVAMLVALAMAQEIHQEGIPDLFYAQRIRRLVEQGRLEAHGDLQYMRTAEVRLPGSPQF